MSLLTMVNPHRMTGTDELWRFVISQLLKLSCLGMPGQLIFTKIETRSSRFEQKYELFSFNFICT